MKKHHPFAYRLAIAVLATGFFACGNSETTAFTPPADAATLALIKRGESLIATNCYSCHSAEAPLNGRLAPPMVAVQSHYLTDTSSFSGFTDQLVRFVQHPNPYYSKMPGARRRFGLMPALPLPDEDLEAIAAFIFYTDLEAPEWFEDHQREERKTMSAREELLEHGRTYALQTKTILGKSLMAAINYKGAAGAVDFCNTRAIPLTDSSAQALGIQVRRVSDRPRNPDNEADSLQLLQIEAIRGDLAAGQAKPVRFTETEGEITGYYPIVTNAMCLQCHGEKERDIKPATLTVLEALYPDDLAIGYASNQLRGIWVVTMPREL